MTVNITDRTIALAGIFQAVRLVQQTAQGQPRDAAATTVIISSIFNTDPASTIAVYGDAAALRLGLETLLGQLGNDGAARDMELTGYAITLMHLERTLTREQGLLDKLGDGIEKLKKQIEVVDPGHVTIIAALAGLYKDTVSTLQPRIMVKGDENVLGNEDSKNMIRALLLAAMRATVLWRQCGGNRVRLILQRKAMLAECRALLTVAQQAG